MPMTKTFWAESFGMLVDPYGTAWMVSGGMRAA
jgi:PhnB protein